MRNVFPLFSCVFGLCLQTLAAAPDEAATQTIPTGEEAKARFDAAKVVYDQVARLILPDGKYCADDHSGNDTLKRIKSNGTPADFEGLMLPADDAPFEARRQYVMVMAELGPPSRYLALIDKLVSERPGDHDLSALQLVAAPSARRRVLIQAMARDFENDLSALEERLSPLLAADGLLDAAGYRTMLEDWHLVVDLFTALTPEQNQDRHISSYNPIYLLFGSSADFLGIPPLRPSPATPTPTPELAALALQRNETIHAVATAMLTHPGFTRQAFAILHHGRNVFHLSEAKLHQLALRSCQLILRDEDRTCRKESYDIGTFVNLRPERFSDTRLDIQRFSAGVTPYGYLLDQAIKTRKFHDFSEFLQCFSGENRKTLKTGLDFFINPALSSAKSMLPEWVADDEPIPAPELALPAAIAGLCGIDTSKGFTTLLDATESSETPYLQSRQQVELFALWANVSLENQNITQLAATIQEASRRFIGRPGSPDALTGTHAIGAILHRIHPPPDDCALVRVFLASRLPAQVGTSPSAPAIRLPESASESARILLAAHLLHPGPGMFAHVSGRISSSDDLGFLPFAVIRYKPKEESPETDKSNQALGRELLKIDGPERFWARITGAYLAKQDATIVIAEVERDLTVIKTWPAPEQKSFAGFLIARWPVMAKTGSLALWFKQVNLASAVDGNSDSSR